MNIPFKIKFTIFDETKPLTKKQIKIKNNLIDMKNDMNDMKKILKNVISGLNDVKFLDRFEPSICSLDEKKQLRMSFCYQDKKYQHSIHFNQDHSLCKEYFSIEELKNISNKINIELEEYLHTDIWIPILYIEIDDL